MPPSRTRQTDVLIVGGGGAATAAALSAHGNGARTLLAVKGRFGVPGARGAGATSNPIGDFWTLRSVGPKGGFFNPPDAVHADMLQAGLGMADPALCRIYVDEAPSAIARLREMGMAFQSRMLASMPANEANKTNNIVAIQKAVIEGTGTEVLEGANLTDLIVEDGVCRGAVGVHDDGEPFAVRAGAVVLATGGVGQLFRHGFNPPGNTGDGYAMALRAGAELTNMEFMQQGLATTWPAQAMIMLYEMEEPFRLLNSQGRAFLADHLPDGVTLEEVCLAKSAHWPVSCRDGAIHLDRAIKAEALSGPGASPGSPAPVFLDLSRAKRKFMPELLPPFLESRGIDVFQDLLQVQNHHHTSNGGIRIDTDGQSGVRGLFAVGEASAWQGADRLGGTMLGGSQVFGWRAGAKAAEVARHAGTEGSLAPAIGAALRAVERMRGARGTTTAADLHAGLKDVMWETLIVEKDAASLARARDAVATARERLRGDVDTRRPADLVAAVELGNMLAVAEVIVEAADLRTESRGSHFRSDFPERDDGAWLTNVVVSRGDDVDEGGHAPPRLEKRWLCEAHGWTDRPGDIRLSPWG